MRRLTLLFLVLLVSCDTPIQEKLRGTWRRASYETENRILPEEIKFSDDSVYIIDGRHFRQSGSFKVEPDSLFIKLNHLSEDRFSLSLLNDTTFVLGGEEYSQAEGELLKRIPEYDLIDYHSGIYLSFDAIYDLIHLFRTNGKLQLILDDSHSELEPLRRYLEPGTKFNEPVYIFVEKSIDLVDLANCYKFIYDRQRLSVILITGNNGLGQFQVLPDNTIIGDSLMVELFESSGLKPSPTAPIINFPGPDVIEIEINRKSDLANLPDFEDSNEYLIKVNYNMDIKDYFDLLMLVDNKSNVIKSINGLQQWLNNS